MTVTDAKKYPALPSIAPWLTVDNGAEAAAFYKAAFDAVETYQLETPDGLIVKLSVGGSEFWVSGSLMNNNAPNKPILGSGTIRMILTVSDPDTIFKKALEAGASQVFPIGDDHGWRLGRLADPFGLHWEIGHPL